MKLKELKAEIDKLYNSNWPQDRIDNLDVVVITSEPSLGGRACSSVHHASKGFDWENYRFNLVTDHKLKKVK